MKPAPFNLLLETASRDNILVLTTSCSTSCIFCSHQQNPEEIRAYYVDRLNRGQIDTLIEFLDGTRKIVIGESATRICEGEPFLCEDIIDILESIRTKYRNTTIQLTTSGIHLDRIVLTRLEKIGGIELNISLNSSSIEGRRKLYRGKEHESALEAIKLLKNSSIPYSGSVVAMPHLTGWEDIRATLLFLQDNGASTIRVFLPGYTKFTKGALPPDDIRDRLAEFTAVMGKLINIPLVMEPSGIKDVLAVAEGVLTGSPAWEAGISKGDRILSINGTAAASRVDAYYKAYKAGEPRVEIQRCGEVFGLVIKKQPDSPSGMVFNYDIHPDTILDIRRGLSRNKDKSCLIITSELAYDMLKGCIPEEGRVEIEAVRNEFFGGNIMCAGLLTVSDIEAHLYRRGKEPDVLLLPEIMFDTSGQDLLGQHFMELEGKLGIKVEVI